jgi:hypothetical protein
VCRKVILALFHHRADAAVVPEHGGEAERQRRGDDGERVDHVLVRPRGRAEPVQVLQMGPQRPLGEVLLRHMTHHGDEAVVGQLLGRNTRDARQLRRQRRAEGAADGVDVAQTTHP